MEMYSIFTVYVHASSVQEILTTLPHTQEKQFKQSYRYFAKALTFLCNLEKTKHKVQVIFKSSPRGNKINVKCLV